MVLLPRVNCSGNQLHRTTAPKVAYPVLPASEFAVLPVLTGTWPKCPSPPQAWLPLPPPGLLPVQFPMVHPSADGGRGLRRPRGGQECSDGKGQRTSVLGFVVTWSVLQLPRLHCSTNVVADSNTSNGCNCGAFQLHLPRVGQDAGFQVSVQALRDPLCLHL